MTAYEENRPDPDELLASIKSEEEQSKRGKLKIFSACVQVLGKHIPCLNRHKSIRQKGSMCLSGI